MKYFSEKIQHRIISDKATLLEALNQMNVEIKVLFVFRDDQFIGMLSIGDIQRSIIKQIPLDTEIGGILRQGGFTYASVDDSFEEIKELMVKRRTEVMPIVDNDENLIDVYFWDDIFVAALANTRKIELPVVIMAGGEGTRLKPLTNIIPKPLIPIGDKTILEIIMDKFENVGCSKFYMSVNYKADILKYYLENIKHCYDVVYIKEDKPLGTIGSVSLLKNTITTPFFVSNCDIIIEQDYRDVYDYHLNNKNDITIVAALKSYKIPYGVIETGEDGLMTSMSEKPELTYLINSGVYLLEPELINEIPDGEFYHITHLIEKVRERGGKVGVFPVSEKSWVDIGDWKLYAKTIKVF